MSRKHFSAPFDAFLAAELPASSAAFKDVEFVSLDIETTDILGVPLPRVVVPLNPGKNITVISEVVAMRHLLRYAGVDSAQLFQQNLKQAMRPVRDYLEQDFE